MSYFYVSDFEGVVDVFRLQACSPSVAHELERFLGSADKLAIGQQV